MGRRLRESPLRSRETGNIESLESLIAWWERTRGVDTVHWRRKMSTAGGVPLGS